MTYEEKARFTMRRDVLIDTSLSAGARVLYAWLDDMAAFSGQAWPSNEALSKSLGFSERSIQRFLEELGAGGYIKKQQRRNKSTVHILTWKEGERRTPTVALVKSTNANRDTHERQPWRSHSLLENQVKEPRIDPDGPKTNCAACLDLGFTSGDAYSGDCCECLEGERLKAWRETSEFAFISARAGRT